jgi:hypothetical protein
MIDPEIDESQPRVTDRTLRQFAGLWLLILGGLAVWHGLLGDNLVVALVLGVLGVAVGVLGLATPRAIRPLFTGLMMLTYPIGWLVSRILLIVLFYGMFAPLAVLFRLIGRDALVRRRRPEGPSYWTAKPGATDVRSYLRQS